MDRASAGAATARASVRLREAGLENAGRDARLLVAAASGLDPAQILSHPETRLTDTAQEALETYISRRMAREPVSRILGYRGFYGRDFLISPQTLDPRPESETLVDTALQLIAVEGLSDASIRILDVGTGSGCLLGTLLAELPRAEGVGTDIEIGALVTARRNAERLGVAKRACFHEARSLEGVEGTFRFLVSNPPYIPTADIKRLQSEVRDFDPISALDGGRDGLDVYREIAAGLSRVVPDGWALFEVGAGQAGSVATLLAGVAPEALIRCFRDVDGRDRCVAWKARPSTPRRKALGIGLGRE
jgi:release factor glutamine methyltransferase